MSNTKKEALHAAFVAGFCTSNDLPETVELVEGSILKTINHWFEQWYEDHHMQSEAADTGR